MSKSSKPARVKPMSKNSIFKALAEKLESKTKRVKQFFETLNELMVSEATEKGVFIFPGLGRIVKKDRKARMGRNPRTGESIKIPAKTVLKFRIAKSTKVAILGEAATKRKSKKDKSSKDKKSKSNGKKK